MHQKYLPTIIGLGQAVEISAEDSIAGDIILGLDPGTRRTGFGLIQIKDDHMTHLDHGVIRLDEKWSLPRRLKALQEGLQGLYTQFSVHTTVVEKIFFGKNADSAFKLGHARGVCLMAAAQANTEMIEFAARYVKKAITGDGGASKEHVQMVILNLLKLPSQGIGLDASDALALAVAQARLHETNKRMKRALEAQP